MKAIFLFNDLSVRAIECIDCNMHDTYVELVYADGHVGYFTMSSFVELSITMEEY